MKKSLFIILFLVPFAYVFSDTPGSGGGGPEVTQFGYSEVGSIPLIEHGNPVYEYSLQPESRYDIFQSTIAISSTTPTIISSTLPYRAIYLQQIGLSTNTFVFFRMDASSSNITTVGSWITPGEVKKIETNQPVYLQLTAGSVGSVDYRRRIILK